MKKTFLAACALSLAAALAAEPLKVGFVYVGPVGDHGWTYQHDLGRLAIEQAFGSQVETTYLESVSEGPDAERAIERLARDGNKLIFTTSFGYMNPTLKVAKKFPDVRFEHATGFKRADNVSTYSSRFYEGRYVIGQIAAKLSKQGTAGYIVSFPIPEVVRGINSFMLGAQSVNPDFKVKIVWVNSWYDPGKEAEAAQTLIDQGADILVQHTDSTAPLQVAQQNGVLGFGQASDMAKFAPDAQLTSIIDAWEPYYIERTRAALEGAWQPADTWGGLDTGMVTMAPFANMPAAVAAEAEQVLQQISSGAFHPFTGPIYDQKGDMRIARGEVADDGALLEMNWYVQGVTDQLPN